MLQIESLEDLNRLVSEKVQETAQVEFKRQLPESGKNDDLARDLAAMANSGGGVIVYGVDESNGVATGLSAFDITGAVERITLVASTIDEPPQLNSVQRIDSEIGGFLVVTVAPTLRGPHFVRGQAFGRTAGGNTTLTRRQTGELFARSEGFAAEFGLVAGTPGRVLARIEREEHQRVDFGSLKIESVHYLVLSNDGDTPVHGVTWEWSPAVENGAWASRDPQPVETLHPRSDVRTPVVVASGVAIRGVVTRWTDIVGQPHEATWPVTF